MEIATRPVNATPVSATKGAAKGHEAQGFALAQTIIANSISAARQLQRAALTAFSYSVEARAEAIKQLVAWMRQSKDAVKNSGNLAKLDKNTHAKISNSAVTRVSEFRTLLTAMNSGMNLKTIAKATKIQDPENVSFHVLVGVARQFVGTAASLGRGRKPDSFDVKLDKWLTAQAKDNGKIVSEIRALLADYLPKVDPDSDAENVVHVEPVAKRKGNGKAQVQHVPAVAARTRKAPAKTSELVH